MTHVVLRRMMALIALVAVAFPTVGFVQPVVNRAALVVKFDNDRVAKACVEFSEDELTGIQLLERSRIPYIAQSTGMGAAICKIDGVGCEYPTEDCFCKSYQSPAAYWALYGKSGGSWAVSGAGASNTKVRNGDIQGWSWGSGSMQQEAIPPSIDFASICTIPAAQSTATPRPSVTPRLLATARPSSTPRPTETAAPPAEQPTFNSAPTDVPRVAAPRPPVTRTVLPSTATTRPTRVPVAATATVRPRPSATREQKVPTTVPATPIVEPTVMRPGLTATQLPPTATKSVAAPTATTRVLPLPTRVVAAPTATPQSVVVPTAEPVLPTDMPPPSDVGAVPVPPADIPPPSTATSDAAFDFNQQATPVIIMGVSAVAEASVIASADVLDTVAPPATTVEPMPTNTLTLEVPTVAVLVPTASPSPSPVLVAGGDNAPSPSTPDRADRASLPLDPLVFIVVCAALVAIIVKVRRRQSSMQ